MLDGRLGWSAVIVLATTHFAAFADRSLPAVFAPLLKAELGLSDAAIGALLGPAFVVFYVFGLLASGHWISRFNPWRVAGWCVLIWTAGAVLFSLADSFAGLLTGRVLLGAGQAAFAPAALMLLAGQTDPARRSRSISAFTTGSATGRSGAMLLGGAALAWLGSSFAFGLESWRTACLVLTAPNLVLAVLLLRSGISQPRPITTRPGLGAALRFVAERPGAFISLAVAGAGSVFLVQAVGAWTPSLLHRTFGLEPAAAAVVFGVIVLICAPLGHLGAGWLLARPSGQQQGPAPFVAAAAVLAGGAAAILPHTADFAFGVTCIAVLMACGGLAAAGILIGLQSVTHRDLRPSVSALYLTLTTLAGVGGGPWLTGMVSDAMDPRAGSALGDALSLSVMAACGLVALVCMAGTSRWRPQYQALPGAIS